MPSTNESFDDGGGASFGKSIGGFCYGKTVLERFEDLQYPVLCSGIDKLFVGQQIQD